MCKRWLKNCGIGPHELQLQNITRNTLFLKIGAAKKEAGRTYSLVKINLAKTDEQVNRDTFSFRLRKKKLREVRRREGCYLLRSNLTATDFTMLWQYYIQLTEIEQAFKELKGDLSIRPIYQQTGERIEVHIFVAFIAYCFQVTLKHQARQFAPGLPPRSMLEKFSTMQMMNVHLPTTDGRYLILPRHTQPDRDLKLLPA
jgi:transposase